MIADAFEVDKKCHFICRRRFGSRCHRPVSFYAKIYTQAVEVALLANPSGLIIRRQARFGEGVKISYGFDLPASP